MAASAFVEIPELDLTAWRGSVAARKQFAGQLREVCHDIGFFHLVGHGIEPEFIDRHIAEQADFFALTESDKAIIDKMLSPHFRGWERVGAEMTGGLPDLREQLDLSVENPVRGLDLSPAYLRLDGPNQWLSEDVLPGFRHHMAEYFQRMAAIADELLDAYSVALGLDTGHLRRLFGERPLSFVKLINYPPTPDGGAGVNAHHDAGFLTLLLQHDVGGLQVQNPHGDWIDVPVRQDAFVVNIGEMLQEMTGNYFVATTHRVIASERRQSSAWFHGPDLRTALSPLPLSASFVEAVAASRRHSSAGFMARREELDSGVGGIDAGSGAGVFGQQLWNYYCRSYPANVARHHPDASAVAGVPVDQTGE
ncbi:MAG: isopenicillin N synthase family oxygenase [Actinobacteria bacterium]|nr:MAG: isopenicillin N synthase family oxygenase [Actinomycetota bacterium]